jgi:hypothetical protein
MEAVFMTQIGLDFSQNQILLIAGVLLTIGSLLIVVPILVSAIFKSPNRRIEGYGYQSLSLFQRLLIHCSGANIKIIEIIASTHPSEADRFTKIGGLILLIALYGAISGAFAINTINENNYLISILGGILWGIYVFSIDRLMISMMRSNWKIGMIRIVMAGFIALTISVPIELCLFEKEINAQHQDNVLAAKTEVSSQASHGKEIDKINSEIKELEDKIFKQQKKRDQAHKEMVNEAENPNRPGTGPLYEQKRQNYLTQQKELDSIRKRYESIINGNRKRIKQLLQDSEMQVNQNMSAKELSNGLLGRLECLSTLSKKYPSMFWGHWIIRILLMLIEISPVLVKMLAPESLYDKYLVNEEKRYQLQLDFYEALDREMFSQFDITPKTQNVRDLQDMKDQFATTLLGQYKTSRTQPLNAPSQVNF